MLPTRLRTICSCCGPLGSADADSQKVFLARVDAQEVPQMMDAIARAWRAEGVASHSAIYTFFKWLAILPSNAEPTAEDLLQFTLGGMCSRQAPPMAHGRLIAWMVPTLLTCRGGASALGGAYF